MFNSIGPLTFLALVLVFIVTFVVGLVLGFKSHSSDASKKEHCFGVGECLTIAVSILLIAAAVFFASLGDATGAIIFGWLATFATGLVWGLTKCDFGHVRMM